MFGFGKPTVRKPKPTDILSHHSFLIENFQFSTREFYAKVEEALADRRIPDIKVERVEWPEGGIFSARREYLRVTRGRLVFDICGAPFGSGFFVSSWLGRRAISYGWALIFLITVYFCINCDYHYHFQFGYYRLMDTVFDFDRVRATAFLIFASPLVAFLVAAIDYLTRQELDGLLCQIPVIGIIYARLFHRITYYRIDNMEMFQRAVHNAYIQVVNEIAMEHGIKPLSELESKPILTELWRR